MKNGQSALQQGKDNREGELWKLVIFRVGGCFVRNARCGWRTEVAVKRAGKKHQAKSWRGAEELMAEEFHDPGVKAWRVVTAAWATFSWTSNGKCQLEPTASKTSDRSYAKR